MVMKAKRFAEQQKLTVAETGTKYIYIYANTEDRQTDTETDQHKRNFLVRSSSSSSSLSSAAGQPPKKTANINDPFIIVVTHGRPHKRRHMRIDTHQYKRANRHRGH